MKKFLAAVAIVAGASTLSGCDLNGGDGIATPDAYYQGDDCYYVSSPAEAVALQQAGLCPAYTVPYLMPVSWEEEYYDYYSSPAYYNTYVPVRSRSIYVKYTVVSFRTKYSKQITVYKNRQTIQGGSNKNPSSRYGSYGSRK